MGNHLGLFPEASECPEGHEQAVQAVGGQGSLRGVTPVLSMLETSFWCQTPGVWVWGIIWNNFLEHKIELMVKNGLKEL